MTFFYDLNKKLAGIANNSQTKQLNERDEGKPGKMFSKIAKDAGERYGSKAAGERVAGKIRADLAKQGKLEENAAAGYSPEMQARIKTATPQQLAQMAQELAGGPAQYQSELKMLQQAKAELSGQMDEGMVDTMKQGAQAALQAIGSTLGHGSDEDMIKDLQKKAGVPVTGKVPPQQPGQQPTGQQPMSETAAAGSAASKFDPSMHDRIKNASKEELSRIASTFAGDGFGSSGRWDDEYKLLVAAQRELLGSAQAQNQLWATQRSQGIQNRLDKTLKSKYPNIKVSEDDIEEGPEVFKLKADAAKKAGEKEFRGPDGKMYPVKEGRGAKPDYIDLDNDRNRKESMKQAAADKKAGKHKEEELDEGWDDMLKDVEKRRGAMKTGEKVKGHKGEIEKTATGIRHTRSYDAKTGETDSDDDKDTGEKRGRGRPKKDKAPERVTGKAYKHKGGRKTNEDSSHGQAQQIYNELADIRAVAKQVQTGQGQFPQGFASRLEATLWAAMTLLKNQQPADAQVRERKLSSSEKEEREDIVKGMKKNKGEFKKRYGKRGEEVMYATATKMAKERGPGNPDRKKKEKTEETTVAGSVAPAAGGKAKKGGSIVGKGIYDSLNRDLEAMIAESMNVSVNMSMDEHGQPHKNITVSAEGEAAEQLAQLLNLAGMSSQGDDHGCGCDTDPCSCESEELDENQPDWPTNTEVTGDDDPHLNRWAGGLNKPKETGQTTIPVVNRDPARGSVGPLEMAEAKDLGMKLYAELKSFKG